MSRFDNNCLWITSGFDDRFAVPVLVGIVGGEGEVCCFRVAEFFDVDASDKSAEFDLVQKFHFRQFLRLYLGRRPGRASGFRPGQM